LIITNIVGESEKSFFQVDKKNVVIESVKKAEETDHPLATKSARDAYWYKQQQNIDNQTTRFQKKLNEFLDGQAERIIEYISPESTRVFRKKNLIDDAFNLELEIKIGGEQLMPLLELLLIEAGIDTIGFYSGDNFVISEEIKVWLEQRGQLFLTSINETNFKELQTQFSDSLSLGESRKELVARVQNTYSDIKIGRAKTIARTEVHGVSQKGNYEALKQAGIKEKIWVSARTNTTRPAHWEADGQRRLITDPFIVMGESIMMPGEGSAANSCNCQCVI
jgi:hypothetical protein